MNDIFRTMTTEFFDQIVVSLVVVGIAGWILAIAMIVWVKLKRDPFADPIMALFEILRFRHPRPTPSRQGPI